MRRGVAGATSPLTMSPGPAPVRSPVFMHRAEAGSLTSSI